MLMVRFLYKFHISCEYFISLLSVKIWLANIEGLNRCTNAEEVPFALVAEVHNKHQFSTVQIWPE